MQEGDVGALRLEYLPCDSTVNSFSYKEALILSEVTHLSQISNETGFHFLFVITSSSTAAVPDACNFMFSDDFLASLPTLSTLICALFFVAAAISQLEAVAASPTCAIFPQTRTRRQQISRHSQNQTQQSLVLFGLVPEAVWQCRKFFSKPILCWPSCILYNYCKSLSSNCTSATPADCCSCVYWALTVDLWLRTKL